MVTVPSLTKEEKARFLQALREDAAFREEVRRLLLEELLTSMQDLRDLLERLMELMREGFGALRETTGENSRQIAALTERMERVEAQIATLTEQVRENSRQIAALTERMERVEAQIAALTERMERVEAQIAALTDRMERVEAQIAALTEQVRENSRQIAALTERMERVEAQIAALTGEVREQRIRLDDVSGIAAEARGYEEIELWLRSRRAEIAREYLPGDLQDLLGVSAVPDGVLLVRGTTGYVFLVYEITFTPALRDVQRVTEWLGGFRTMGWPAMGLVYFRRALPEEEVTQVISENGREVIRTIPGMRTLREEAARSGVLLMQHGASPWRPEGWQPPRGLEEIPQVLSVTSNWF